MVPSLPGSLLCHTTHRSSSWIWFPTAKKNKPKPGWKMSTASTALSLWEVHQNLWLFSIPWHEIVLSCCRNCMGQANHAGSMSQQSYYPRAGENIKCWEGCWVSSQIMLIPQYWQSFPLLCQGVGMRTFASFIVLKQVRKPVKQGHKEIFFFTGCSQWVSLQKDVIPAKTFHLAVREIHIFSCGNWFFSRLF